MYAKRDYYIRVMLVYELLRVAAVVTCFYFPAFTSCSRHVFLDIGMQCFTFFLYYFLYVYLSLYFLFAFLSLTLLNSSVK